MYPAIHSIIQVIRGGNVMHIVFVSVLSVLVLCTGLQANYTRYELKPEQKKKTITYYTDDERYAVYLSDEDIAVIQRVLKAHTWADQDYNKPINRGFIRRIVGGCGSCNQGSCNTKQKCQKCSAQAELLKRVLTDFKGRTVKDLYTSLGLRREI